ncbi:MAG: TAXI family TRAP transporter solute-binding subunit [Devosiaceae bacterium]|nr:TAXI family TRAP transporter solute-binding subunit [Devosiaceae bacterium]
MNRNIKLAGIIVWLGVFLSNTGGAFAQSFEVNIMTGGATGTYIQIGKDIAALAEQSGRDNVLVVESAGSMENILAVRSRPQTQFGIVQSDVLDFIRTFRAEDADMRSILRNTRYVYPLYKEEVHIVARKSSGIGTLTDLNGKIVATGGENSGTSLTSSFLFDVGNIRPARTVSASAADSLEQLRAGTIDAFVYVAGSPTKLLSDTNAADDLRLVTIPGAIAGDYYVPTTVKAGTYPWMAEDVMTASVRAVLMTYEFDPNRNAYFKASCDAVTEISYLIKENMELLRRSGHPKWNEVDIEAVPSGWEQAACVKTAFDPQYQPPERGGVGVFTPTNPDADCSALANPVSRRLCLMQQNDG